MKKVYEFKMYDENGCVWNFEDAEDNVLVKADSAEEAEEILMGMVDYDSEEEAAKYSAYDVDDIEAYKENHYYVFWN